MSRWWKKRKRQKDRWKKERKKERKAMLPTSRPRTSPNSNLCWSLYLPTPRADASNAYEGSNLTLERLRTKLFARKWRREEDALTDQMNYLPKVALSVHIWQMVQQLLKVFRYQFWLLGHYCGYYWIEWTFICPHAITLQ